MIAHAHEIGHHAYAPESIVPKGRDGTTLVVVVEKGHREIPVGV
jgi:hypothetical protein